MVPTTGARRSTVRIRAWTGKKIPELSGGEILFMFAEPSSKIRFALFVQQQKNRSVVGELFLSLRCAPAPILPGRGCKALPDPAMKAIVPIFFPHGATSRLAEHNGERAVNTFIVSDPDTGVKRRLRRKKGERIKQRDGRNRMPAFRLDAGMV